MIAATVLSLLLLAAVQGAEDFSNGTDCETAKESVERSFQILSISTRQLGQKCREEKRECDKVMREMVKLKEEKTKCDEKVVDLDDQIANYAASFDELGTELQKCKTESENEESATSATTECGNTEHMNEELQQLKTEKENLESQLEQEKAEKAKAEEEYSAEKIEKEKIQSELEQERAEKIKLETQISAEKEEVEKQGIELQNETSTREKLQSELEAEKQGKEALNSLLNEQILKNVIQKADLDKMKAEYAKLEKLNQDFELTLQKCNELRIQTTPEISNELENKNMSEKCSRIGRDLDLIRTHAGIYYFNYNTALPWLSANDYCRTRGLELATAETGDAILEVGRIRSRGYHVAFWTSASDRGHSPGHFHWANGRKVAAELWSPGQPDQATSGREDCAYVFGSRLKDSPCTNSFYFACQVPQECVPHLR